MPRRQYSRLDAARTVMSRWRNYVIGPRGALPILPVQQLLFLPLPGVMLSPGVSIIIIVVRHGNVWATLCLLDGRKFAIRSASILITVLPTFRMPLISPREDSGVSQVTTARYLPAVRGARHGLRRSAGTHQHLSSVESRFRIMILLGFSHVYREMAFGSISGCIRGDVAHAVNARIHHVSGTPRLINVLHCDIVGERRFLPEYQTVSFSRTQSDFEGRGTHCNLGIFRIAYSYHNSTGAGVIRDRRPRRKGNDRRTRQQIRLQLLCPRG